MILLKQLSYVFHWHVVDIFSNVPVKTVVTTSQDTRAGTNTPSDEYDTYREYRVANTIRIANTLFLRG